MFRLKKKEVEFSIFPMASISKWIFISGESHVLLRLFSHKGRKPTFYSFSILPYELLWCNKNFYNSLVIQQAAHACASPETHPLKFSVGKSGETRAAVESRPEARVYSRDTRSYHELGNMDYSTFVVLILCSSLYKFIFKLLFGCVPLFRSSFSCVSKFCARI